MPRVAPQLRDLPRNTTQRFIWWDMMKSPTCRSELYHVATPRSAVQHDASIYYAVSIKGITASPSRPVSRRSVPRRNVALLASTHRFNWREQDWDQRRHASRYTATYHTVPRRFASHRDLTQRYLPPVTEDSPSHRDVVLCLASLHFAPHCASTQRFSPTDTEESLSLRIASCRRVPRRPAATCYSTPRPFALS